MVANFLTVLKINGLKKAYSEHIRKRLLPLLKVLLLFWALLKNNHQKKSQLKIILYSKLILLNKNLLKSSNIILLIEHQHRLLVRTLL